MQSKRSFSQHEIIQIWEFSIELQRKHCRSGKIGLAIIGNLLRKLGKNPILMFDNFTILQTPVVFGRFCMSNGDDEPTICITLFRINSSTRMQKGHNRFWTTIFFYCQLKVYLVPHQRLSATLLSTELVNV